MITNTIKINIRDNCLTDAEAVRRIQQVLSGDRCSNCNKSYCACTMFSDNIVVIANKNKYDVFDVYLDKRYC